MLGVTPRRQALQPANAIMTALSVQFLISGSQVRKFRLRTKFSRNELFAQTPPEIATSFTPVIFTARFTFAMSDSITDFWNDAHRSFTCDSRLSSLRTCHNNAVFKPLKLNSISPEFFNGTGNLNASGSPDFASLSISGPPGYGKPRIFAALS